MSRADYVGGALNPGGAQKVAPTGPNTFWPLTSEGIEPTVATLEHNATEGDRFPSRQKRGGRSYAGPLEGGQRPISFGTLLTMTFGEPVSSTEVDAVNAPGVFKHIWNPKAAGKRPMPATIWTVNQDVYMETGDINDQIVDEYIGAMVNEMAWTLEANNYLLYSAGIQAIRNLENVAAPVATMDDTDLWSFDEIAAEISVPSINAGAFADFPIYAWNMSYGNALAGGDRFRIGSTEIVKLRPGNVEGTVGFTVAENLDVHYRRAIAQEPELVSIRLTANGRQFWDGGADPTAAIHESLMVEIAGAEYTSGNIPINADETLEDVEVEANMVKDTSGAYLTVELVNEHDGSTYVAPAAA